MTNSDLLKLLRCPETRQPLALADERVIRSLNDQISAGIVRNRGGVTVRCPCDSGLVREDGRYLYPIREAIPEMLISESMPMPLVQRDDGLAAVTAHCDGKSGKATSRPLAN
jgi:uncharacterized protein YbaR (Trm112 family)